MVGEDDAGALGPFYLRDPTPAESVWWARVRRKAYAGHEGPLLPKVLSDWAHQVLHVIGASREIIDGRLQPIPPERLTHGYKAGEIQRLSDELGRRLGVGPRPHLGALPLKVNLRELSDDELAELDEIVGRIEDGDI